ARTASTSRRPLRRVEDEDDEADEEDEYERRPRRRRHRDDEDDEEGGEAIATFIPYRNPKALAGYYLGFFSLIPVLGIFLAIIAIVLAILGLRYRADHPEAKGMAHAIVALVMSILSLVCNPIVSFFLWKIYFAK